MKKVICFILALTIVFALGTTVTADSFPLPTIDEALRNVDLGQITEVSDNLDDYSVFNGEFEDLDGDLRMIVLQREAPEKEFTENVEYPPFTNEDGFPEDFTGVDKGSARVWLRSDLMKQIPEDFRADSMKDATCILMAETLYEWDGTVSVADYKETDNEELPDFENAEEMAWYLLNHPKEVESITYYPKFGIYTFVTLYETSSKKSLLYDYTHTQSMRFAKNPQASDQWGNMGNVRELLTALDEEKGINPESANELIELLDFIPEAKRNIWKSCIDAGEYSTASHSINEYYWTMAEELKNLDPSEENKANYDLIIAEKNDIALQLFANYCEYDGFERAISSIESSGDYMAKADTEWLETTLKEVVDLFSGN